MRDLHDELRAAHADAAKTRHDAFGERAAREATDAAYLQLQEEVKRLVDDNGVALSHKETATRLLMRLGDRVEFLERRSDGDRDASLTTVNALEVINKVKEESEHLLDEMRTEVEDTRAECQAKRRELKLAKLRISQLEDELVRLQTTSTSSGGGGDLG